MITDRSINPDTDWPQVWTRDEAVATLQALVDRQAMTERMAQTLWDDLLKPLYDLREVMARWPRGRCSCGAVHPYWRPQYPGLRSESSRGHRMWCRWYVGPLQHRERSERSGIASGDPMVECSCGKSYYKWADDEWTKRNVCPDMLFIWKGEPT